MSDCQKIFVKKEYSDEGKNIIDFLRDLKSKNRSHTHVLVGPPYGKYSLETKIEEFWDIYIPMATRGSPMYLAEFPQKETPVFVDIDLKIKKSLINSSSKYIYNEQQIKDVINAYQTTFQKILIGLKPGALTCVLLEKPAYEQEIGDETYIKNGFHLHFPKLFLERKVQEVYLIPIVKEKIKKVFSNLNIEDPIDNNSINVHWLLYGSQKPNSEPYLATKCFIDNCEEVTLEEGLNDYKISIVKENNQYIDCEDKVEELLPRILSIFLYDRSKEYYYRPEESIDTPLMKKYELIKNKRKEYDQLSIDESLLEAQKLIHLFNIKRADDRSDWLSVGFCLWNITHGDEDGLSLWLEFSENSDKYNEAECIYTWNTMRENKYTIGTLRFFAKQDNPKDYSELLKKKGSFLIKEAINGSHNDIAKILFNEYGNEFICTSISNKNWYQFKKHIWQEIDKGTYLRERISCPNGIIIKQLKIKIKNLVDEMAESDNDTKEYQNKIKKVGDVIRKCKDCPFKNNVMRESEEVFYNADFSDLLNKDPYLVAFENGVYDLNNETFRDGKPEDFLSMSIPINYIDYGSIEHQKINEVDDFFRKVFPNPSVREYFLDQVCHVFVGGNHDKVILFWIGEGNNGKTVTQTLFEKMLGKLAIKFNTSIITGKKQQIGSANPERARAGNGVRWTVMDEPNSDEIINVGALKELTGNDSYYARDLWEKGKTTREIIPMFKLHMICNKLPSLRDADRATWNRIRVIPFESTFLPENECPESYEEQLLQKKFPMDKYFSDKIPELIQPLAWYLLHRWKNCSKRDRIEPNEVKVATENYIKNNDIYSQFENQCIFPKENSKLTIISLYSHFKEWFREECPNMVIPTRSIVKNHFIKQWGDLTSEKYWLNKTCKIDNEENENIINPLKNNF